MNGLNIYSPLLVYLHIDCFIWKSFGVTGCPSLEQSSPLENTAATQDDESEDGMNSLIFSYERLKVNSSDPVAEIDVTKREVPFL